MSTHTESDTASKPGHGDDHPFKVTVRSLAGHTDKVTVKPSDTIGEVTDKEVKLFVNKGWLTAGDYSLTPAPGLGERARPGGDLRRPRHRRGRRPGADQPQAPGRRRRDRRRPR